MVEGGQYVPILTVGDNLWKKAQKNEKKNNTSENKIIPQRYNHNCMNSSFTSSLDYCNKS